MANTSVKGRVTDEQGAGLGGLTIEAYDIDLLELEDRLGVTESLASGEFSISYDPGDC